VRVYNSKVKLLALHQKIACTSSENCLYLIRKWKLLVLHQKIACTSSENENCLYFIRKLLVFHQKIAWIHQKMKIACTSSENCLYFIRKLLVLHQKMKIACTCIWNEHKSWMKQKWCFCYVEWIEHSDNFNNVLCIKSFSEILCYSKTLLLGVKCLW